MYIMKKRYHQPKVAVLSVSLEHHLLTLSKVNGNAGLTPAPDENDEEGRVKGFDSDDYWSHEW